MTLYTGKWESYTLGTDNITIAAVYTVIEYTATFKDGDTVVDVVKFTVETDSITEPAVPTHTGYTGKWENYTLGAKNIVIEAQYAIVTYSIVYENTKDVQNDNPVNYTVTSATITLKDLTKTGYTFNGWYDKDGEKVTSISTGTYGNVVLTANWSVNTYTLTYNGVESTEHSNPTSYTVESDNITLTDASRVGYKFLGWFNESDEKITIVTAASAVDLSLTAKWEIITYTITYQNTKGASNSNPTTYTVETASIVLSKIFATDYTFNGWYNGSTVVTEIPLGSTGNLTLTAAWVALSLGEIEYNTEKLAISVDDVISAELFGATCYDSNGELAQITVTVDGVKAAGETISVRLVAQSGSKKRQITISGIKVYGDPTLAFDSTVDYFNPNSLTAEHFGASGVDSFGEATKISVSVEGEYQSGDIVKIVIASTDPAGNITYGYVENVKAYGLPIISYHESITSFKVDRGIYDGMFGEVASDSFGVTVPVTASLQSGEWLAGNEVVVRLTATDSKGNTATVDITCKVYGMPTISNAEKLEIKATDTISAELLGITATDSFGNAPYSNFTLTLAITSGVQTAGSEITITATAIDICGNVATKDYVVKVYGTPTITYSSSAMPTLPFAVVTFDLNYSGVADAPKPQRITATNGLKYPSIPVRDGYIFRGWFTSPDCTTIFDFSSSVEKDVTVYAGWHKITTTGTVNEEINILTDNNSSTDFYSYTTDSEWCYTYFTILKDGTYKLYYKNEVHQSGTSLYNTYVVVYNATRGSTIRTIGYISNTSFSYTSFTAKAGDVIYVKTDRYSASYSNTFSLYVTGATLPNDGGTATRTDIIDLIGAKCQDSFGENLAVNATLISGDVTDGGSTAIYRLTATDIVGNVQTIDVDIRLYDVNDIVLNYAPISEIAKLSSDGSEFAASATDSFGEPCTITIEAVEGYRLIGGRTISIYIVATDKAGNRCLSEPINNIKIYDTPSITFSKDNNYVSEDDDLEFLFTVRDSFGLELYADITYNGELIGGNFISVTVTATDDAGNIVNENYTLAVVSTTYNSYVDLYVDGEYYDGQFVDSTNQLPVIEDIRVFAGWKDASGVLYTDADAVLNMAVSGRISLYATFEYTYIYTTSEFLSIALDGKYILANDLDFGGFEYTPRGSKVNPFTGVLNGNGHKMFNFVMAKSSQYKGIFAYNSGTIKNLIVSDFSINCSYTGTLYVGGVAGYNTGTIDNCVVEGEIIATATAGAAYVGGITGYNTGYITDCRTFVQMDAISTNNDDTKSASVFTGGIVGYNSRTVTGCDVDGNISASANSPYNKVYVYAGGLAGYNTSTISDCFNLADVTVSSKSTFNSISSITSVGGLCGENTGSISECSSSGHVTTTVENTATSSADSTNTGVRTGGLVGYNKGSITTSSASGNVLSTTTSSSIPSYSYAGGLVGYAYLSSSISQSSASGKVEITATSSYESSHVGAGGLVGASDGGTITNCYATGDVSSKTSSNRSYSYAGGLTGTGLATITNCYATGDVYAGSTFYYAYAGGLCGYEGKISNCYATGDVTVYSSTSSRFAAGVVGYLRQGTYSKCYRLDTQTIENDAGYGSSAVGIKTELSVIQTANFHTSTLGWDASIWNISDGKLPTLK